MIAIAQFRFCLSFIPLLVSVPFAWRTHENRKMEAANALINIEDRGVEAVKLVEQSVIEESKTDRINNDEDDNSSKLAKEVIELDSLLGIKFGTENRLSYVDLAEVVHEENRLNSKILEYLNFLKALRKEHLERFLQPDYDIMSWIRNMIIFTILLYFKPVIKSCCSCALRMSVIPLAQITRMMIHCMTRTFWTFKGIFTKGKQNGKATVELPSILNSLSNIKDPESISALAGIVENHQETANAADQAAVFDEKRNLDGFEERRDNESSEWLEDSFIEGGIQTFLPLENDNSKSTNKTENCFQGSINNAGSRDINRGTNKGPLTSTPANSGMYKRLSANIYSLLNETREFAPEKLKKFMHEKYNDSGLGMVSDLGEIQNAQCIIVDEQKKEMEHRQIGWGRGIDDFVNSTKTKIRNRLMNISYI